MRSRCWAFAGGRADRIPPHFPAERDQLVGARRWTELGLPAGRAGARLMAVIMTMVTAGPAPTGTRATATTSLKRWAPAGVRSCCVTPSP